MDPGPSGYSGVKKAPEASNTYAQFIAVSTSCVKSVLEKSSTFGFREVDVILGYKIQFIPRKTNCSHLHPSEKHFIFQEVSQQHLDKRKVEIINTFFQPATLALFKENEKNEQPTAMELIEHAFRYDIFINKNAKHFHDRETIPTFLERQGDSGLQHLHFLEKIAAAMQAKPEIDPNQDGQYLLSLWVDLSNATAFKISEKKGKSTPASLTWDSMIDHTSQSPSKRLLTSEDQKQQIDAKRVKCEPKQTGLPHSRQDSTSSEDTIDYSPEQKPLGSLSSSRKDSTTSLCLKYEMEEVTSEENDSEPEEDNFLDKARKEGKSEAEIAVLKFNYLINQAGKNAELIRQEVNNSGCPRISDNEKRNMMRNLFKIQPIVNGIQTKK